MKRTRHQQNNIVNDVEWSQLNHTPGPVTPNEIHEWCEWRQSMRSSTNNQNTCCEWCEWTKLESSLQIDKF